MAHQARSGEGNVIVNVVDDLFPVAAGFEEIGRGTQSRGSCVRRTKTLCIGRNAKEQGSGNVGRDPNIPRAQQLIDELTGGRSTRIDVIHAAFAAVGHVVVDHGYRACEQIVTCIFPDARNTLDVSRVYQDDHIYIGGKRKVVWENLGWINSP